MNKLLYPKLAANNIQSNARTYFPYMLTCVLTVAMYYMICSLSQNPGLEAMRGGSDVSYALELGTRVTAIFAVIFLFYTNSFLMKRRKKEFGLYNILGMEKRHISRVLGFETLYIAAASLLLGLGIGIVLDRLMFLVLLRMLGNEIPLGFEISTKALGASFALFAVIFLLIFLNSLRQIHLSKPIELLSGSNVGEKEPKTKWIMTILGLACLGGGYYISITTTNPVAAVGLFFIAVILVIVGTYFLFIAGSIAILKLLRKNKSYYYNRKHFTSVSGMIYRMKQNAVGLANICILSTMVLVMVSTTLSLWIGMEDILHTRYPQEIQIKQYANRDKEETVPDLDAPRRLCRTVLADLGLSPAKETSYIYLSFSALEQGDFFNTDTEALDTVNLNALNGIKNLFFIPLADYNAVTGEQKTLSEGEILLYSNRDAYQPDQLRVLGETFRIKEKLSGFPGNGQMASEIVSTHFIVVRDMSVLTRLNALQAEAYDGHASLLSGHYSFDLDCSDEQIIQAADEIRDALNAEHYNGYLECRAAEKDGFIGIYGGLFFIGIFLGALFLMATILIIYYKQISEGYEDKARYDIMQKVGMTKTEIKRSIGSQILTVFFLPLVTAGIHVAFAFPVITRLLAVLSLTNTTLFGLCTIGCFLAFALIYAAIYSLTAQVYYRIVSK